MLLKEFGPDALLFDLGFSTADTAHFPAIQSDVAVAVNAALRDARIAIPDATAHGPPAKRSS